MIEKATIEKIIANNRRPFAVHQIYRLIYGLEAENAELKRSKNMTLERIRRGNEEVNRDVSHVLEMRRAIESINSVISALQKLRGRMPELGENQEGQVDAMVASLQEQRKHLAELVAETKEGA